MIELTSWILVHRRLVAVSWVVVTVLAAAAVPRATAALSSQFSAPGQEGYDTNREVIATYGNGGNSSPVVPVLALPPGTTVDTRGIRQQLASAFARLERALPGARIASFPSTGDRDFVSDDGRTTFALVAVNVEDDPFNAGRTAAEDVERALRGVEVAGAEFRVTGLDALRADEEGEGGAGVLLEAAVAGLMALVVLAVVFGSLLAFVPLVVATVSILVSFLLLWPLAEVIHVFAAVQFLIALIGLGVAIDYALLIVTRWREERTAGADNETAVTRAMDRAGRAVVLSGTTGAIGLLAMVALPVPFIRSLGFGGMLIPAVSVLVTVTLLPVLLASFGERLEWPRRRTRRARPGAAWERWAAGVVRRRVLAAGAALLLLAALLIPAGSMNFGNPRAESLAADGRAREGLTALHDAGLAAGVLSPFDVLVRSENGDAVAVAVRRLAAIEGVGGVVAPDAWRRDGRALAAAFPEQDGNSAAGRETLARVRAAAPTGVTVGGQAAQSTDFVDAVYGNFPFMLALILILTFVLLARAFRSVLLPLKAVVLNLLSVGAAWGVTVLIWQEGLDD